ncbi:hypothetical protein BESB_036340 [Besnoitia besnoiti]|uniref:O-acyltransferase WSD1 C-terminal domain-containing protein n=1 Tax=Besnoitia besnoiti TaxID=94643 RepID=A0A2A9MM69_BESBE|nr:hypothetical protein BESB_036340 [Besnoitia besnoiti]PFH37176.1 hypothetical protein BESB_036340 [Besnoitia besnoiti]
MLQWAMTWEEFGEQAIEKLIFGLGNTVPVAAELALSIAAALTSLVATDANVVAAVDAMTETEARAAAEPQGSVYTTGRRREEDLCAGTDSRRPEDMVKRLWRVGEGWWLSWPWRSSLVAAADMRTRDHERCPQEKPLHLSNLTASPSSRPPRRTEIFEVLSGQELMMFSQPLMVVSGVGFSDHLSLDDLIDVVETQLLAKKELGDMEIDVMEPEHSNDPEPLTVYKHPRLRTVIGKLFGRYCWVRAEDFDVRNHVLKLNRHEVLSLLRHHKGRLHRLHAGVILPSLQHHQSGSHEEESRYSACGSTDSEASYPGETLCDGGDSCSCIVTSAEAQALENILATQALQPSMPLWQFVLLEHVELPVFDEAEAEAPNPNSRTHGDVQEGPCTPRPTGSMVMFRIHHAVADGIAITNMFLSDVLSACSATESGMAASNGDEILEADSGASGPCYRATSSHSSEAAPEYEATSSSSGGLRASGRRQGVTGAETTCSIGADKRTLSGAGEELTRTPHETQVSGETGTYHDPVGSLPEDPQRKRRSQRANFDAAGTARFFPPLTREDRVGAPAENSRRSSTLNRRPIKSLVPPLTRPSSVILTALMQLISYLHVPFTVVSLLMLTEEKSWDSPERSRPQRSGRVSVLQPIRFRLQDLKRLRRKLAALPPGRDKTTANLGKSQIHTDAPVFSGGGRLRQWRDHLRDKPLRSLLLFVARSIHSAVRNEGVCPRRQRPPTRSDRRPGAEDGSCRSIQQTTEAELTGRDNDSARSGVTNKDLFTINELLATCLVGGICRYVHRKVALKYAASERQADVRVVSSGEQCEKQKSPSHRDWIAQEQRTAFRKDAASEKLRQATASLATVCRSPDHSCSNVSKIGLLPYNKSVSALSSYTTSTCSTTTSSKSSSPLCCPDCGSAKGSGWWAERFSYVRRACGGPCMCGGGDTWIKDNAVAHVSFRGPAGSGNTAAGSDIDRPNECDSYEFRTACQTPSESWIHQGFDVPLSQARTEVIILRRRQPQAVTGESLTYETRRFEGRSQDNEVQPRHSPGQHSKEAVSPMGSDSVTGESTEQGQALSSVNPCKSVQEARDWEEERRRQVLHMELDMLEQLIPQLNIVVPVNLRTTEEESFELRNNFTTAVVQVAAADGFKATSAYERLLGVRKSLRKSVKSLGALVFAFMEKVSFCTTPDFLLFLQLWLTKKVSLLFSNVPGPSELPQIHGRQVHAMHFIGPLAGQIGLIVSAFSYADHLDLVITADTAMLESPELFRRCILEEYRELKRLCPLTPSSG